MLAWVLVACTAVAEFVGPGVIWPCQNCGGFPVSLKYVNAYIATDLEYNFRPTTPLDNACLELGIPSEFDLPENTHLYTLRRTDTHWIVHIPQFSTGVGDSSYAIKGVKNPRPGNYGPFFIRTRQCCECQVVDEMRNFHFIYITAEAYPLRFSMKVYAPGTTEETWLAVDMPVTLYFRVDYDVDSSMMVEVTLDPIWGGGTLQFSQLHSTSPFEINIDRRTPPYVPRPGYVPTYTVRVIEPPVEIRDDNNYRIAASRTLQFPLRQYYPGQVRSASMQVNSGFSPKLLTQYMKLFVEVEFALEHTLNNKDYVLIEMSDPWQRVPRGSECFFVFSELATCAIDSENYRVMRVSVAKEVESWKFLRFRGLIYVQSEESLRVTNITSYNRDGLVIDQTQGNSVVVLPLAAPHGVRTQVAATDSTGKEVPFLAGNNVNLMFSIMPQSADYFDGRQSTRNNFTLTCPNSFVVSDNPVVNLRRHSTDFTGRDFPIPLGSSHPQRLGGYWQITVNLTLLFPLSYGMFTFRVENITLPLIQSSVKEAHECSVQFGSDTVVTQAITIRPSARIAVDAFYYCLESNNSAPIGIYIAPEVPGRPLTGKEGDYYLELEFLVNSDNGFPPMLGANSLNGSKYPSQLYINNLLNSGEFTISGNSNHTRLLMKLPIVAGDISSILLRTVIGDKGNSSGDVPVIVRIFYIEKPVISGIRNVKFEKVARLVSGSSGNVRDDFSVINLKVLEIGSKSKVEVSLGTTSWVAKYLYMAFPMNTSLSSVRFENPEIKALSTLFAPNSQSILMLKSISGRFPPKFNITNISIPPSRDRKITVFAGVSDTGEFERSCKGSVLSTIDTPPIVAITAACIERFSLRNVKANLQLTVSLQNGIVSGGNITGKVSENWGTKRAVCDPSLSSVVCDISNGNFTLAFQTDILDSFSFNLRVSRVKVPASDSSPRSLFEEVTVSVPGTLQPLPQADSANAYIPICS